MKRLMIICLMGLMVASAQAHCPDNLIENGDFESGNTGITSDYDYVASTGTHALWDEAKYAVGLDPLDYHYLWTSFGDHTTDTGLMMICNGQDPDAGVPQQALVWGQDVVVAPSTLYDFSVWIAPSYRDAYPVLQVSVNGDVIGTAVAPGGTDPGDWYLFTAQWTSGVGGTVAIEIRDLLSIHTGNDFVIDDICFVAPLITVAIDIKPGSCPNPFNAKSKGSVPVAIVGSDTFDVTDVNVASLTFMLEGVPIVPDNVLIADVTEPHESNPEAEECQDCFDEDDPANFNCDLIDATDPENPVPGTDSVLDSYCGDGFDDLVVKFDTQALAAAIAPAERDDCLVLTLTGETLDGTPIEGSDSVWLIRGIEAP